MAANLQNPESTPSETIGWLGILSRVSLLWGVVGAAGLVACVWNRRLFGEAGVELAVYAMVACGLFAGAALAVVGWTSGSSNAFGGILLSILIRSFGPISASFYWQASHRDWPVNNLIAVFVPIFLVALTVETILVVDIVSTSSRSGTTLGKGRATRKMHG